MFVSFSTYFTKKNTFIGAELHEQILVFILRIVLDLHGIYPHLKIINHVKMEKYIKEVPTM